MNDLVLGLDPSLSDIPSQYVQGHPDILQWGQDVITACESYINGVKFQSAYFESLGLNGLNCLAELMAFTRSMGLKIIMDAKKEGILININGLCSSISQKGSYGV